MLNDSTHSTVADSDLQLINWLTKPSKQLTSPAGPAISTQTPPKAALACFAGLPSWLDDTRSRAYYDYDTTTLPGKTCGFRGKGYSCVPIGMSMGELHEFELLRGCDRYKSSSDSNRSRTLVGFLVNREQLVNSFLVIQRSLFLWSYYPRLVSNIDAQKLNRCFLGGLLSIIRGDMN